MPSRNQNTIHLIVGVTGHRDLVDGEIPLLKSRVREFFESLEQSYPELPILVLSSLAEGADTLVVSIAEEMGIAVQNVLPMPVEHYRADFSGPASQEFEHWLARNETLTLPLLSEATPVDREQQYERLGAFLAAHSHILLALWDGTFNQAKGGTADVIRFHQLDISTLAEDQVRSSLDIQDDESDLVYQIVTSRRSKQAVAEGLTAGDAHWFTRDDEHPRVAEMPERYRSVLAQMCQFNRDDAKLPTSGTPSTLEPQSLPEDAGACRIIQSVYGASDHLATHFQKRMLWALRATLACTLLAGLSFIIYADFEDQELMLGGYFLFTCLAIGSFFLARVRDWQRRHLDYRVLAEALRVQYYWALAGVAMHNPSRFSHDSFFQGRDLQLGWIRNVMRYTGLLADVSDPPRLDALNRAIDGWVGDPQSGQLGYYTRKAEEKLRNHHRTQHLTTLLFGLGLLAALFLALQLPALEGIGTNALVALMGLFPLVAAIRQNYAHRLAERELAAQYAHMLEVFSSAHRLLKNAETIPEKRQILRDLGEVALNENAQWVLRQRQRPLPGGGPVG